MMNFKKINLLDWPRKDHYDFYKDFSEPFFGLCFNVDITNTYLHSKKSGESFFLNYLYATLKAINGIDEFKYRIQDNEVVMFDQINVSPTIGRKDGSFGFSYMDYYHDRVEFLKYASVEVARVKNSSTFDPSNTRLDTVHLTAIPWIKFSSISHARQFDFPDSIPKMAFGKLFQEGERYHIPVSVHAHHALIDGAHIGRFNQLLEENLDNIG